ncbi:hypothetical protein GEMRC1_009079 [Eukaryota sp. GEM-RC1]
MSLISMLQRNTSLLVLGLSGSMVNALQFQSIIKGLGDNLVLRCVNLQYLSFEMIISLFSEISSGQLIPKFDVFPHSIDICCGLIRYQNSVENGDIISLFHVLKSNLPIKRVFCRGLRSPNLMGVSALFQIQSINRFLIGLDISPHLIDPDNGLFFFSPERTTQLTVEDISFLHSVLKKHIVFELTLSKCLFPDQTITVLCDLLGYNNSLTSVDFSHCRLSDDNFKMILSALQFSSSSKLSKLIFASNFIGNEGAIALAESLKSHSSISELCLAGNCIGNEGAVSLAKALKENF